MAHQAKALPSALLQQRQRITTRRQEILQLHRRRQTSRHANFSGLQRPPQGAAQQAITVELQATQLRRHGRSALTAFSRKGPLLIRAIRMAIFGNAVAPEQQFALNWFTIKRFTHNRFALSTSHQPNSRRALRCRLASGCASQPRLRLCTAGARGWPASRHSPLQGSLG